MRTLAVRAFSLLAATSVAFVVAGPAAATSGPRGGVRLDAGPPPGSVAMEIVIVAGNGCPRGSASVAVAPDNTAFALDYGQVLVEVGASGPSQARKSCHLTLDIHHPRGYQYAVNRAEYAGYAALARGSTALLQTTFFATGFWPHPTLTRRFEGPLDSDWQVVEEVPVDGLAWSRCDSVQPVSLRISLQVNRGTANADTTSFLALVPGQISPSPLYGLSWRQCP
jgi:hypothetical protein